MLVKFNSHNPLARLDRVFDEVLRPESWFGNNLSTFAPTFRTDISEDEKSIVIEAELPGIKKEDAKISLEDKLLTIKAERKQESETQEKRYRRTERAYGSFSRSFVLSENIDRENISASYENGVLKLTLPKIEPVKNTKDIVIQ